MDEKASNVRAFNLDANNSEGPTPEELLRNALSQCAEIRSRGAEPFVAVLLSEPGYLPQLGRSPMNATDILAFAARLQMEADRVMYNSYSEMGEDE